MPKKKKFDYEALFTLGISIFAVGIVFLTAVNQFVGGAFMIIGLVYLGISLKNKKKWRKKK